MSVSTSRLNEEAEKCDNIYIFKYRYDVPSERGVLIKHLINQIKYNKIIKFV